ncbi:MAG: FMN reductase [Bacteroidetes bacterium]|nr:FMN reductase [Bacteroidota bacterium]
MKTVAIVGSSRNDGDAAKLTELLIHHSNWELINLNDYQFSYFDYRHENRNDDYLALMKKIICDYDTLVFVTPVYWYAMSGIMKVFFDRFTDLLTLEKDLGRQLRGKNMAAISCSVGKHLGDYFWLPFSETANYLGMKYLGNLHTIAGNVNHRELSQLIAMIEKEKPEVKAE